MRNIGLLVVLLGMVFTTVAQTKLLNLEQTINSDKAKNIKALIHISGGKLAVKGGSEELAQVKFTYDEQDWVPTISYTENNELGKLVVKASTEGEEKRIDDDNNCQLVLNSEYNYSLGLVLGAGLADLNFENFNIEKALFKLGIGSFNINLSNVSLPFLKIEAGIGEVTLDLSGEYKNDLKAQINAGIGELKVYVPGDIGIKFIVNGFLGDVQTDNYHKQGDEYTNDLFGKTKHSIVVKVNGAIGSIKIRER
jgi:hypothetical protein